MAPFDIERDRYEARLKYQRDRSCYLADAREEGREEGLKLGREEARQEGRAWVILRIGTKRFGEPPANVVSELNAITSRDRLDELVDRMLDCSTWDALLEHRSA